MREDCRFCCSQLTEYLPHSLFHSPSLIHWFPLYSYTATPLCLLNTPLLLFLAHTIFLSLTNTAWRAGLPVVSIFHLDAGDSAFPLQFISWITREGHRVSGLSPFPIASAIHRNTWISASCSKWTWRTNAYKHTYILILLCKQSTGDPMSKSENTRTHIYTHSYISFISHCQQLSNWNRGSNKVRADYKLISVEMFSEPQPWSRLQRHQWSGKNLIDSSNIPIVTDFIEKRNTVKNIPVCLVFLFFFNTLSKDAHKKQNEGTSNHNED